MKRKIDFVEEGDHESEHGESESSGDESEDEEPRIKDVLSHLSRAVSEIVLLYCCTIWPVPKIFFSGLPADNYFKINALFPSQTSPSKLSMCYSLITMKLPASCAEYVSRWT